MGQMTNLCIRIDKDIKDDFSILCESIGVSVSTACLMFMKKAVSEQKIPFELTANRAPKKTGKTGYNRPEDEENLYFPESLQPGMFKGVKYDTVLEACWAVFFDTLEVEFEYHPFIFSTGLGDFKPTFKVKCWGRRNYEDNFSYDLYVIVADGSDDTLENKIAETVRNEQTDDETYLNKAPFLIVSGIPDVRKTSDIFKTEIFKSDECISDVCKLYPFNYFYIDNDFYPAYPGVKDGKFYLFGADYLTNQDYNEKIVEAFRKARTYFTAK